jgi:hypothetical protein
VHDEAWGVDKGEDESDAWEEQESEGGDAKGEVTQQIC